MYKIGQLEMKLDGIITEFCDVYSPIAQMLRSSQCESNERKKFLTYEDWSDSFMNLIYKRIMTDSIWL